MKLKQLYSFFLYIVLLCTLFVILGFVASFVYPVIIVDYTISHDISFLAITYFLNGLFFSIWLILIAFCVCLLILAFHN